MLTLWLTTLTIAQAAATKPGAGAEAPVGPIAMPVAPEDSSLVRVEAKPADHIGRAFTLVCAARVANYYNFGYSEAARTHASLFFEEVGRDGNFTGRREHLYVARAIADPLLKALTKVEEESSRAKAIRVRCAVDPGRLKGDPSNVTNALEVVNWQFLAEDRKTWGPWAIQPTQPRGKAKAAKKAPAAEKKPADPAARAASLLKQARALEKQKQTKQALGFYKEVVAKYPGSEAATEAAGRIEDLEEK